MGFWRRAEAGFLVTAVDPDGGHPELLGTDVVVIETLRDVQDPVARHVDRVEGDFEVFTLGL